MPPPENHIPSVNRPGVDGDIGQEKARYEGVLPVNVHD